jgi:hypothetical protein
MTKMRRRTIPIIATTLAVYMDKYIIQNKWETNITL